MYIIIIIIVISACVCVCYRELLDGYKKYMRNLHRQGMVARNVLKMDNKMFPGLKTDEE